MLKCTLHSHLADAFVPNDLQLRTKAASPVKGSEPDSRIRRKICFVHYCAWNKLPLFMNIFCLYFFKIPFL